MQTGFQEIQHTADWALQVWAPDLAALLQQAALGMSHLMGVAIDPRQPEEREFAVSAVDGESLLVAFLNRILYEMEMDRIGFTRINLTLDGMQLRARLSGGRLARLQKAIKAVTFHNLAIQQVEGGLRTTIVFDV